MASARFNNLLPNARGLFLASAFFLLCATETNAALQSYDAEYESGHGYFASPEAAIADNASRDWDGQETLHPPAVYDYEGTGRMDYGHPVDTPIEDGIIWHASVHCNGPGPATYNPAIRKCEYDDGTAGNDQCSIGDERTFRIQSSGNPDDLPSTMCGLDGCTYSRTGLGIGLPEAQQSWGKYEATSLTCEVGVDAPDEGVAFPGKQCIEDAYGNKTCLKETPTNCGEFNGKEICAEDIPDDGECHLLGASGFICAGGSTPPDNLDGTPQNEVGEISDGVGTEATLFDTGGGKDQIDVDQGNEPEETDETGVPTGTDDMFNDELEGTGIDDFISGIGSEGSGGGVASGAGSITFDLDLPDSASCQQIPLSIFGKTTDFPSASGCQKLQNWRDISGWAIYAMTAFYLFGLATRRPA